MDVDIPGILYLIIFAVLSVFLFYFIPTRLKPIVRIDVIPHEYNSIRERAGMVCTSELTISKMQF